MNEYDPKNIEKKWQDTWAKDGIYNTRESGEKFYILDMFPYPSGAALHVGHPKGYIATDIYSRMMRMKGKNVLHPMGWDAFGLPAEQFAIKNKIHPKVAVDQNVARFKEQLQSIGFDYDWSREINTTDPEYYKWTQWAFVEMHKAGLAYQSHEPINWCPECKTGLANEDLEDGKCERCGSVVEKKPLRQWGIKITKYADRLLEDMSLLDKWPESTKASQRNWIGRSEGSQISFTLKEAEMLDVNTGPGGDAYREGEPVVERENVVVIIEHPSGEEFLCARWKKVDWQGFVTGGIEEGKTAEETALGEVREETGYQNVKLVKVYDQSSHGLFWHVIKNENRKAHYRIVHVKLENLDREEPSDEEKEIAEFVWVPKGEVNSFLKREDMRYPWRVVTGEDTLGVADVFTTRADTLFGVTYIVLAPEHPLVGTLRDRIQNWSSVEAYIQDTKKKSELDRQQSKEKTGVELKGFTAINPADGEQVPVWVADYVLAGYGTGAVMAVPAHDDRDFEFANKYELASQVVVRPSDLPVMEGEKSKIIYDQIISGEMHYSGQGILQNSQEFDGLGSEEARTKITEKVGGKLVKTYRLQDWTFSRQRYWGEPIPIVFDKEGNAYPVDQSDLPVTLPQVESYEPTGTGESPLAGITDWVNVKGKITKEGSFKLDDNGEEFRRETNTMPQWAGSSWYYLRYIDSKNDTALVSKELEKTFAPIDVYVGGVEHATRHLIYARFWHKFLFDIGAVSTKEPFMELHSPGVILAEDGRKMSKRWGNTINPDEMVDRFGADAFRTYEMFMGPFENTVAWNTDGVVGTRRFIEKVWRIKDKLGDENVSLDPILHETISKVSRDIPSFKFNTCVSAMMICASSFDSVEFVGKEQYKKFIQLLAPFAPHMTEELWREVLGEKKSIHLSDWPTFDPEKIKTDTVEMVFQVNGKVRARLEVSLGLSEEEVLALAKENEQVQKWLTGEPKKVIYVQDKLLNIVV